MSARAASSALILSLLIASGILRPAVAGPWLPGPGEYYTELRGGLFTADSYRDAAGDRQPFGGKWEERSLLGTVELGWKKRLCVVMAAPFIGATRLDAVESTTSTGLEDVRLGLRLGLLQGPTAVAAELDWQAPLGYSRKSSLFADSLHGDGLQQASFWLLFGSPIAKRGFVQLGTGLGYRYSTSDDNRDPAVAGSAAEMRSTPFLASADLGLWLTPSLLLCGRYSGMATLSHGALAPDRAAHLAGPALVWRVDDRLDLTAGSWSTVMGKRTLHYDQAYVALTLKQTKLSPLQGFLGGSSPAPVIDGKLAWGIHGGLASPTGGFGDRYKMGFQGGVFADYAANEQLAMGVDLEYVRVHASDEFIRSTEGLAEDLAQRSGHTVNATFDSRFSIVPITLHAKWMPPMEGFAAPYVQVGGGYYVMTVDLDATTEESDSGRRVSESESVNVTKPGVFGGVGVDFKASPQLTVGVFAKMHNIFDEGESIRYYNLGVSLGFRAVTH
jgi:hypothetical protein